MGMVSKPQQRVRINDTNHDRRSHSQHPCRAQRSTGIDPLSVLRLHDQPVLQSWTPRPATRRNIQARRRHRLRGDKGLPVQSHVLPKSAGTDPVLPRHPQDNAGQKILGWTQGCQRQGVLPSCGHKPAQTTNHEQQQEVAAKPQQRSRGRLAFPPHCISFKKG